MTSEVRFDEYDLYCRSGLNYLFEIVEREFKLLEDIEDIDVLMKSISQQIFVLITSKDIRTYENKPFLNFFNFDELSNDDSGIEGVINSRNCILTTTLFLNSPVKI